MTFWSRLDKIVGYIPVVGTIKDSVEAVVLECEGKHEAAKEKAIEAAVDLASDFLTVATFGEGYAVAAAGKGAAEIAIKNALAGEMKGIAKAAAKEAAKDGFSRAASRAIGAAAAGAEAKGAVKEGIANKNRKRFKPKPPRPSSDQEDRDPKRGHHVINNGVRKILPNIIDDFLHHNAHYFHSQNLTQLFQQGYISTRMAVYANHEHPLTAADDLFVQSTVAFTPEGEHHVDPNDEIFGRTIATLRVAVVHYMTTLFRVVLNDESQISRLDKHATSTALAISEFVFDLNSNNIYVDHQALEWWLISGGDIVRYNEVHRNVANMFERLSHTRNAVAITWVRELFAAYQRLNNIRR
jgi:hypothetical protein